MPLNETYLGLIALLFSGSTVVSCGTTSTRHRGLRIQQRVLPGFFCATDLATTATHYVRVMELVHRFVGLHFDPLAHLCISGSACVPTVLVEGQAQSSRWPAGPDRR
jgi:hypothetical protein